MDDVPQEQWRSTPKQLLVYSYEDDAEQMLPDAPGFLGSAFSAAFERNRETYLGGSARRLDVLILRDPANTLASRLKMLDALTGIKDLRVVITYWKEIARAALAAEEQAAPATLVVLYNRWFSDEQYRRVLSRRLGGRFSDASLRKVLGYGGGSSFDRTALSAELSVQYVARRWQKLLWPRTYLRLPLYLKRLRGAREMKVMDRWREFQHDPRLLEAIEDPELRELSRRLFGDLWGEAAPGPRTRRVGQTPLSSGPEPAR
jgi:hypothetical protein